MKINIQPRYAIIGALFVILIAYASYEARALILGPQVWITSPQNGSAVSDPIVVVEGESRNISWISLNDRQIFTDKEGRWREKLLVSPGLSIMTVKARDRFGREIEENVQIVLK